MEPDSYFQRPSREDRVPYEQLLFAHGPPKQTRLHMPQFIGSFTS